MKAERVRVIVLILFFLTALVISESHGREGARLWSSKCVSCHNGETAPSAAWMQAQYESVDAFITAVRAKGNPCMNILKNDRSLIIEVAKELGIQDHP